MSRDAAHEIPSVRSLLARQAPPRGVAACAPPSVRPVPLAPTDVNTLQPMPSACTAPLSARVDHVPMPRYSTGRPSLTVSPQADKRHRDDPHFVSEYIKDIMEGLHRAEQRLSREPYMATQAELSEKMRMILVDWLVEVHLKFKCRPETLFLAVDIVDRYLTVVRTSRSTLQLVGVTSILLAAKYEEIWPPEVKDCVYISANTYTREEILKTERGICVALQFKFTLPNMFHFLSRLLDVCDADNTTRCLASYYAETSLLNYQLLTCRPSQVAAACVMLAFMAQGAAEPWTPTLQHYSRCRQSETTEVARRVLEFCHMIASSKYTAVKRKYSSSKYAEVANIAMPSVDSFPL